MALKEKAQIFAVKKALEYMDKNPATNMPKLVDWVDAFDVKNTLKDELQAVRKVVENPDSNWYKLIMSLWTDIDPGVRNTLFENFIINASLLGYQKQCENKEKYNCNVPWAMYDVNDSVLARRSPCSTFKIISSLIALENGIIRPEDSTRTWSGEIFWNEDWNRDIDFSEAFRTSCVWYYRQVIDDIGKDMMQTELEKLQYGNWDISDWEGRLNTNNNNRALTGFWIESSLMISPKEQAEVMERIFGDDSDYSEKTQNELKQVMLVPEQEQTDISIYGKTGMGKADGIVVDAWFTGFAENADGKLYFCVHLGRTDGMDVSSSRAKEIAIQIVSDYHKQRTVH